MDDIRRPQSSTTPRAFNTTPVTDIAGVTPRSAAPTANSVYTAAPVAGSEPTVSSAPLTEKISATSSVSAPLSSAPQNAASGGPVMAPTQPATFEQNPPSAQATSGSLLAEIEAQEKTESESRVQQAPTAPRPKKHGWFPIFMAILIALGLLAGAGYAYWQNNKQTKTTQTTKTTSTPAATKKPATTADIDAATKAIDTSLTSLGQATDVLESDLSDTTLGL